MRRGFEQLTSSSESRSTGTRAREQAQRTRQGRNDAPAQLEPITARRNLSTQPYLTIPQQSVEDPPASPELGRKSPAYFEGKNPYGQILENVDHPYRKPKVIGGAPSQIGATSESRPRTSGSFYFKTRPESKAGSDSKITKPDFVPPPQPRPTPIKPVSVQAAKSFFEAKSSQGPSGPLFAPSGAATANTGAKAKKLTMGSQPRLQPHELSQSRITQLKDFPLPNLPLDGHSRWDTMQPLPRPPSRGSSELAHSHTVIPSVPPPTPCDDRPLHGSFETFFGNRNSMVVFEPVAQEGGAPSIERPALDATSTPVAMSGTSSIRGASRSDIPNKTVRRHSTSDSISRAESNEGAREASLPFQCQAGSARPDLNVREAINGNLKSTAKLSHIGGSSRASVTDEELELSLYREITSSESLKAYATGVAELDRIRASGRVAKRVSEVEPKSLSLDGSNSLPSTPSPGIYSEVFPGIYNIVPPDEAEIEVPDHVDSREAFGRRQTKDFGFPGARIKPGYTHRAYKPLQDPGTWIKKGCGHFSYMAESVRQENAAREACRSCISKVPPDLDHKNQQQRIVKQLPSNPQTYVGVEKGRFHDSTRHRRRREHLSSSSCHGLLAKDLESMINSILKEHTKTLQAVINGMKYNTPVVARLREATMSSTSSEVTTSTIPSHALPSPFHMPQTIYEPDKIVYQQRDEATQQVHNHKLLYPHILPRSAQKLNIGAPRQIAPNLNDSTSDLYGGIKTMDDLVALVKSVADDLDLDLDIRPSAEDDELFDNAPFDDWPGPPTASSVTGRTEDVASGEAEFDCESWLGRAFRYLAELLFASPQLESKGAGFAS